LRAIRRREICVERHISVCLLRVILLAVDGEATGERVVGEAGTTEVEDTDSTDGETCPTGGAA